MPKSIAQRFLEFFHFAPALPVITEESSLREISAHYPHARDFLHERYDLNVSLVLESASLRELCQEHALPPPQIVFMEIQMAERTAGVKHLSAREAKTLLQNEPHCRLFDAREPWERKICEIAGSEVFDDEKLAQLDKSQPILVYCHFGVRSFNAAALLCDAGFQRVYVIQGGIEAWSVEIDPEIPRYEAAYC